MGGSLGWGRRFGAWAMGATAVGIGRAWDTAGSNARIARRLWHSRSGDRRFALLPYDGCQVANFLAAFGSAVVFLMLVVDPYTVQWKSALPPGVLSVFSVFNKIGQCDWALVISFAIVVISLGRDAADVTARARHRHWMRAAAAGYIFVSVAGAGLIAAALKYLIGRARPAHFADAGSLSFDFLSSQASWASFPSGHATSIMAFAAAIAILVPRLRYVCFAAGFWIGFGRVATGAHYASDVVCGCALGALVAWLLARKLAQRRLVFRFNGAGGVVRSTRIHRTFTVPVKRSLAGLGRRLAARPAAASSARFRPASPLTP